MRLAASLPCGRIVRWTPELLGAARSAVARGTSSPSSSSQQHAPVPPLRSFTEASLCLLGPGLRSELLRTLLARSAEVGATEARPRPARLAMECPAHALQAEMATLRSHWLGPRWDAAKLPRSSSAAARGGAVRAGPRAASRGFASAAGATKPRPQGQALTKGRPGQRAEGDAEGKGQSPARSARPTSPAKAGAGKGRKGPKEQSGHAAPKGPHKSSTRPAPKAAAGAKAGSTAEPKPLFRALPLTAAPDTNAQAMEMAEDAVPDRTAPEGNTGSSEATVDNGRDELGAGAEPLEDEMSDDEEDASAGTVPLFRIPADILPQVARSSKIKSAEFLKSSADVSQCPNDNLPEIAVIGRSNVGKSSLINMLTHRRELAQTSKKPGKTQLINHYLINCSWYLVDLPGYGYAVAPKAVRNEWNSFTKSYFLSRPNLTSILLLVDASIPPLQVDLDCADWLGQHKIPVTIVFTKCDRRKKRKNGGRPPAENVAEFEAKLAEYYEEPPPWIMTSSVSTLGKDTLLAHIAQIIHHWKN